MKEPIAETKMHAMDYWQVVRNRWGTILLTFLLVLLASLIIIQLLEKKYVGRVKLQVHHDSKKTMFERDVAATGSEWLETEFKIITARETLMRVVKSRGLMGRWNLANENSAVDKLERMVEPSEERGTSLISIEVYSTRADEAAELANAVADAYVERRKEYENSRNERAVDMLARELETQKKLVEDKQATMLRLMEEGGIIDLSGVGGRFTGLSGIVEDGTSDMFKLLLGDVNRAEQEVATMEAQLTELAKLSGDELIEHVSTMKIEGMTLQNFWPVLQKARLEKDDLMANGLGKKHPRIVGLNTQITSLETTVNNAIEAVRKSLDTRIRIARAGLAKIQSMKNGQRDTLSKDKSAHSKYLVAKQDYEQQFNLSTEMEQHILKERVDLVMPMQPVERHEIAFQDNTHARPNIPLLLGAGAVIGLFIGLVLAFFLEYLDTSVKTLDDVERYLGVPVLAVIPKDVGILHKQSGLSPDAEAYRILRTNIEFNRKSADANAITIVSGGAGEGKSTTLVNLAYICAQGGYNTLMIDGDLRRPKLHTFFDINNSVGLTNYLTTALALEDVILQTPIDNLYFMPSGILPADAAGILNSRRMSELIQDLKNRFDLVLIDSPPILGVSDASVLASEVDLTIIVIQHRKLPRQMLLRVKQAIENVGGNLLGVVLNNVDVRSDSQYQYYTSYYTYYSPTAPENKPKSRPSKKAAAAGKASTGSQAPADSDDNY